MKSSLLLLVPLKFYKKKFRKAIRAARQFDTISTSTPPSNAQQYAQSYVSRTIHRSNKTHYLNKTAIEELRLVSLSFQRSDRVQTCPIAHLVDRVEDCVAHGDSSLDSAGGFSIECRFWWYHEWRKEIRNFTLRHNRNNKDGKLISVSTFLSMPLSSSTTLPYASISKKTRTHQILILQHFSSPTTPLLSLGALKAASVPT